MYFKNATTKKVISLVLSLAIFSSMTAAAADLPETEAETMLSTENLTFAQLPDKLKQTAGISTATESPTLETVDSTNLYSFTTINADGSKPCIPSTHP